MLENEQEEAEVNNVAKFQILYRNVFWREKTKPGSSLWSVKN